MAQRKFDIQSKVAVIGAGLLGIRIAGNVTNIVRLSKGARLLALQD